MPSSLAFDRLGRAMSNANRDQNQGGKYTAVQEISHFPPSLLECLSLETVLDQGGLQMIVVGLTPFRNSSSVGKAWPASNREVT